VCAEQGEHIGRIFARWVTDYFMYCLKITEIAQKLGKSYSFSKNGLGYILGDFFTKASGHPGAEQNLLVVCFYLYLWMYFRTFL
jgi:hypothetical protein